MRYTGFDYNAAGVSLPIMRDADGDIYLYDPQHALPLKHYARAEAASTQLGALGINAVDAGIQTAAMAANFIPGVGQILSAALQIGDAIFGGGDPVPLSELMNSIAQLRGQIGEANRAMGTADSFVVPSDFDAKDKDRERSFIDAIVTDALGVTAQQIQDNRRDDYYKAIKALQGALAQLQASAHDQGVAASVQQALIPSLAALQAEILAMQQAPAAAPVYVTDQATPAPGPSQDFAVPEAVPGLSNTDLLLIGGGVAIVLVLALRS